VKKFKKKNIGLAAIQTCLAFSILKAERQLSRKKTYIQLKYNLQNKFYIYNNFTIFA